MAEVGSTARTLDATNNRITEIPDAVLQLNTLQRLLLSNNSIATVPRSLCVSLTALKVLVLDHNSIASLPDDMGLLTRLERLCIASNALAVLPSSLGKLSSLQELDVSGNKLKVCRWVGVTAKNTFNMLPLPNTTTLTPHVRAQALPDTLSMCTALTSINASDNYIVTIPRALGSLTNLKTLALDSNRIAAVPPEVLQGCQQLQTLSLHGNTITIEQLEATEGYEAFDARRRGKFDKKIAGGLAIGPGGLDEGIDRRR